MFEKRKNRLKMRFYEGYAANQIVCKQDMYCKVEKALFKLLTEDILTHEKFNKLQFTAIRTYSFSNTPEVKSPPINDLSIIDCSIPEEEEKKETVVLEQIPSEEANMWLDYMHLQIELELMKQK